MLTVAGEGTAVASLNVGAVVSMVKEFTDRALLAFPALSVTVMVQSLYISSLRALKVIVLLLAEDELSELLQLPPYVIVPASFELKV